MNKLHKKITKSLLRPLKVPPVFSLLSNELPVLPENDYIVEDKVEDDCDVGTPPQANDTSISIEH